MNFQHLFIALCATFYGNGQLENEAVECNRSAIEKSMLSRIPTDLCIPDDFMIDQVFDDFDFNRDGQNDLAIRYTKYPLQDGNMRYYSIYERENQDDCRLLTTMANLALPYVQILSSSYFEANPRADSLSKVYPLTTKIKFSYDSLIVSHLIPDFYGKDYVFLFDEEKNDWILKDIRYWIGEVPVWMVRNSNLKEELYGKVFLEGKIPEVEISISKLDLIQSKRIAEDSESEYLSSKYDIYDWEK
ncbi:hypothetical protein RT717_05435 [Imperialibacter roseus]|uniref:Uncharacterized protein n=1 Tax=Imperialibacter roseus TaxID=1324217 RepID=A0ABZ0ISV7_9BACT|nr:hypothetical protein [Imperialibacter roseus]WOK08074.1 hypothetical protein RT717_05435 [Imperialibacter roseus]